MSISLNANFELLSAGLYLDARQQFNTIIEMKDFAETSIPDGFITYNKETQKHYVFSSSNTVDVTLGKWREYNSGNSDEKTYTDKVVKKIQIEDKNSSNALEIIQNHWSEFDEFEFYNVRLGTAKWTWDAEIYAHTQEYGTVLLKTYGSDVPNIFYGKLYSGVWTWKELATMDKVEELSSNLDELFQSVSDGKTLVANAITDKGVSTSTTATFATMATNIGKINGCKEETKSKTFITTGVSVLTITFSANVLAIKQIIAPSQSCTIVPQSSKEIFTINGKELIVHVTGGGTWSFTALIQN